MIGDMPAYKRKAGVNKPDEPSRVIERTDGRSVAALRDQVEAYWHDPDVLVMPDVALELDTLFEVFDGDAFADGDVGFRHNRGSIVSVSETFKEGLLSAVTCRSFCVRRLGGADP
jgi:hypothetical protein